MDDGEGEDAVAEEGSNEREEVGESSSNIVIQLIKIASLI